MSDHEDYSNYEEFGPEPPEFPDELKICGNCEYFKDQEGVRGQFRGGVIGSIEYVAQCINMNSGCRDFGNDDDIWDGLVFVPWDGRVCLNFEPCAEALAEAKAIAEERRDPYAANGVSERDFY